MKKQAINPCQNQAQKKEATSGDAHVLNPKFLHIVQDKQNTIISATDRYTFKRARVENTCPKCDLLNECSMLETDIVDFPFPCLPDNRMDGQEGYFKKRLTPDQVLIRQLTVTSIAFVILVIIIQFDLIPNWLNYLLFELWH